MQEVVAEVEFVEPEGDMEVGVVWGYGWCAEEGYGEVGSARRQRPLLAVGVVAVRCSVVADGSQLTGIIFGGRLGIKVIFYRILLRIVWSHLTGADDFPDLLVQI